MNIKTKQKLAIFIGVVNFLTIIIFLCWCLTYFLEKKIDFKLFGYICLGFTLVAFCVNIVGLIYTTKYDIKKPWRAFFISLLIIPLGFFGAISLALNYPEIKKNRSKS